MHFIDYEEVLKQRLEEILADPNVVSYSLHPDGSPARLSTREYMTLWRQHSTQFLPIGPRTRLNG
jgi:hypothetical protein